MRATPLTMDGTKAAVKRGEELTRFWWSQQAHFADLRVLPGGVRLLQPGFQLAQPGLAVLAGATISSPTTR